MSLIRAIFAFGNGREVANFGPVFTEWLRSAFALGSLWVRSGFASGGEEKGEAGRSQEGDREVKWKLKGKLKWKLKGKLKWTIHFCDNTFVHFYFHFYSLFNSLLIE